MEKQDFFRVLIEKGKLKISGVESLDPYRVYRVIEYQGKDFKLILETL